MTRPECIRLFDVGGTALKCALGIPGAGPVAGSFGSFPMPSGGSREQIAGAFASASAFLSGKAEKLGYEICGTAAAVPGPFDYANGVFLMKHKFASVYGESFASLGIGGECRFVHDVNGALRGELAACGNASGNVALVTLGTGLGFAYSVDGVVQKAPGGSPAQILYNRPFRDGILEDYVSRRGIIAAYDKLSGGNSGLDVVDIAALASKGNAAALKAFEQLGEALGEGVAPVLSRLGIRELILGGQISKSYDLFEAALRSSLPEGVAVRVSDDIAGAVMRGAAALYSNQH
ncbi:MAG: ROK family protein [Bacteroidales bacterium]|nr:ROK family protein [Bacteroidales bacterium]